MRTPIKAFLFTILTISCGEYINGVYINVAAEDCPSDPQGSWETGPSYCYHFTSATTTIRTADALCTSTDSRLRIASIATLEEQSFLQSVMWKRGRNFYIGRELRRPSFAETWMDGTRWSRQVAFRAWARNNPAFRENYAFIRRDGLWQSSRGFNDYNVLCKYRRNGVPRDTTVQYETMTPEGRERTTEDNLDTTRLSEITREETTVQYETMTPEGRESTTADNIYTTKMSGHTDENTIQYSHGTRWATFTRGAMSTRSQSNKDYTCECSLRLPGTNCSDADRICEHGNVVHYFTDTVFTFKDTCQGCLGLFQECPRQCFKTSIDYWGIEGLNKTVDVETPWGRRQQKLGQIFCERYNRDILPPGKDVTSAYKMADCGIESLQNRFDAKVCCLMFEIPAIGKIAVWDIDCTGEIETMELNNYLGH